MFGFQLFFLFFFSFVESHPLSHSHPHHKHKPHHKKPQPIEFDGTSSESFNYCSYNNFISGQKCGDQGLDDSSFCISDIEGNPVCVVSVWCYNLKISCSSNSDCPPETACADTFCGSGNQCNPICGNGDLPYDPLYDNIPYYSHSSDRCYDRSDVELTENTPIYEDINNLREGSTYQSFSLKTHGSLDNMNMNVNANIFETSPLLFASLLIVVGLGTFFIIRSSPLQTNQFDQKQQIISNESTSKIELEPFLRDGKDNKKVEGVGL